MSAYCNFYSRTFIHFIRCTCQVKLLHAQESFIVYVTSFHVGETFCMHLGQVMSALWTRRLLQIKSGWTADLCTCHFLFTNTGLQYKVGPRFGEFCLQHSRNLGTASYWSPAIHSPSPKAQIQTAAHIVPEGLTNLGAVTMKSDSCALTFGPQGCPKYEFLKKLPSPLKTHFSVLSCTKY